MMTARTSPRGREAVAAAIKSLASVDVPSGVAPALGRALAALGELQAALAADAAGTVELGVNGVLLTDVVRGEAILARRRAALDAASAEWRRLHSGPARSREELRAQRRSRQGG